MRPDHCDDSETSLEIEACWLDWWEKCYEDVKLWWVDKSRRMDLFRENFPAQEECDRLYESTGRSIQERRDEYHSKWK